MQDQVPGVAIPWWDWSSEISRVEGIPKAFSDINIGGQPNPLYQSYIYVPTANPPLNQYTFRSPGSPIDLPTPVDLNQAFALYDYGDFSDED